MFTQREAEPLFTSSGSVFLCVRDCASRGGYQTPAEPSLRPSGRISAPVKV